MTRLSFRRKPCSMEGRHFLSSRKFLTDSAKFQKQLVYQHPFTSPSLMPFFFFVKTLLIWQREREHKQRSGRQREREQESPHWAWRPVWGSIPRPQDHDLSQRQRFNQLSYPCTLYNVFYISVSLCSDSIDPILKPPVPPPHSMDSILQSIFSCHHILILSIYLISSEH